MDTTCATLVQYEDTILICHATHQTYWDLPKGLADENENYVDAASRELKEETGIIIDSTKLVFLHYGPYSPTKNISLYGYKSLVKYENCVCTSMATVNRKTFPEVDNFLWTTLDGILTCTSKVMNNFIKRNRTAIEQFLNTTE